MSTTKTASINGTYFNLFATWFILSGAMQGAGYTRLPMIITILCFIVIRLPAAWYFTVSGYGANGTWIAMALTSVIAGILMAIAFKWGNWKHQVV
jgi:Na+-driven multidrug efflux pump